MWVIDLGILQWRISVGAFCGGTQLAAGMPVLCKSVPSHCQHNASAMPARGRCMPIPIDADAINAVCSPFVTGNPSVDDLDWDLSVEELVRNPFACAWRKGLSIGILLVQDSI
eukprot:7575815-Pyramimonas_sp.AAC.1